MKKFLLSAFVLSTAFGVFGQGQIYVDNTANNNPSSSATANGLFFLCISVLGPEPINQDFNLDFYGGTDSANLTLLKTFSGPSATGGNAGPGLFSDPSGLAVTLPGGTTTGFFRIDAWLGGTSYASALARGSSGVFANSVATPPNLPPTLTAMPAVFMGSCPEPSTLALASLGVALLFFRRWK